MNIKCPFCGAPSKTIVEKQLPLYINTEKLHPFSMCVCDKCSLGFHGDRPSPEMLNAIYDNYCFVDPFEGIGANKFDHYIEMIKKHVNKSDRLIEIGSSSGYLLYRLKQDGYTNLAGIEPSPQADKAIAHGLNIRKEYYDANTFEDGSVDVFLMSHVFEHLEDPFSVFANMVNQLSENGKIILETPYFYGFAHEHLYYYSLNFYSALADKYNAKIIDFQLYAHSIIVVFVLKDSMFKAVKISENLDELIESIVQFEIREKESIARVKDFLKKHKKVYWWGAGWLSLIYSSQMVDVIKTVDIVLIDSDRDRANIKMPYLGTPIHYSDLKDTEMDALVMGTTAFIKEVHQTMEDNNIRAKNVIYLCDT